MNGTLKFDKYDCYFSYNEKTYFLTILPMDDVSDLMRGKAIEINELKGININGKEVIFYVNNYNISFHIPGSTEINCEIACYMILDNDTIRLDYDEIISFTGEPINHIFSPKNSIEMTNRQEYTKKINNIKFISDHTFDLRLKKADEIIKLYDIKYLDTNTKVFFGVNKNSSSADDTYLGRFESTLSYKFEQPVFNNFLEIIRFSYKNLDILKLITRKNNIGFNKISFYLFIKEIKKYIQGDLYFNYNYNFAKLENMYIQNKYKTFFNLTENLLSNEFDLSYLNEYNNEHYYQKNLQRMFSSFEKEFKEKYPRFNKNKEFKEAKKNVVNEIKKLILNKDIYMNNYEYIKNVVSGMSTSLREKILKVIEDFKEIYYIKSIYDKKEEYAKEIVEFRNSLTHGGTNSKKENVEVKKLEHKKVKCFEVLLNCLIIKNDKLSKKELNEIISQMFILDT